MLKTPLLSQTAEWSLLQDHANDISQYSLTNILSQAKMEPKLQLEVAGIHCDFSKNHVTQKTLKLLENLCQTRAAMQYFYGMEQGANVNVSEKKQALHMALRNPDCSLEPVRIIVEQALEKMKSLTRFIHEQHRNAAIQHIVTLGIGGSSAGAKLLTEALEKYHVTELSFHFVESIDPFELSSILEKINIGNTLFIVSSKSFVTDETQTNFSSLCQAIGADESFIKARCIAITANEEKALSYGFSAEHILSIPDWVGGRFSIWSSVGFPVMLAIGTEHFNDFLQGARVMDEHCLTEDFFQNPALLLAAMDCWYINFLHAHSRAVIVYSSQLTSLISYLQQLIMESNGKSLSMAGDSLDYHTSPIIWGGIGPNSQHSFQQLLMQGSHLVPIDIILPRTTSTHFTLQHSQLVRHGLAQSEALTLGLGNKGQPHNLFSFDSICPKTLGSLLALYEHRTVLMAALWGINPFDQPGVALMKQLLKKEGVDL